MMLFLMNKYWLSLLMLLSAQSLAEVARQEAERRRSLDQQGVEAKVIDTVAPDSGGNLAVSSGVPASVLRNTTKESASSKGKPSVEGVRAALQKLDRNIQQTEERLESRRVRLQSERWKNPKTLRASSIGDAEKSQTRLKQEIEDLQRKLEQLQKERGEVYDRGRKAGFLPGEMTGRGIIP
jgi:predicted RNase H-like nuclease (RuvC/YqgF family)